VEDGRTGGPAPASRLSSRHGIPNGRRASPRSRWRRERIGSATVSDIGIFGTSGFAREVADVAAELGYRPVFLARDREELEAWTFPDDVMLEADLAERPEMSFAIGIGDNAVRRKVAARYAGSLAFPALVHPGSSFGRGQRETIEGRRGVIVCAGVRFTNNIRVGEFAIFNLNATIGHDVVVEDFVNIAPGACISGNVHLGAGVWIGTGAAVNQGTGAAPLRVGADVVVGSGAVVVKDCEDGGVYVGVPARRIR
jgi:sugar O-acyltransferase (sialic acid O-acetyltransferase NeuD family)